MFVLLSRVTALNDSYLQQSTAVKLEEVPCFFRQAITQSSNEFLIQYFSRNQIFYLRQSKQSCQHKYLSSYFQYVD